MFDAVSMYVARKDRLMKAFWAPALKHTADIFAGHVPAPEKITPEYVHAFQSLNFLMAPRRQRPEIVMAANDVVVPRERYRSILADIAHSDPDRMKILDGVIKRFNKRRFVYIPETTLRPVFNASSAGVMRVEIHEVIKRVNLVEKVAEAVRPDRYMRPLLVPLAVWGPDEKKGYVAADVYAKTGARNPASAEFDMSAQGSHFLLINWGDGGVSRFHFNSGQEHGVIKISRVPRPA